jgi:Ca2+-binding EF-hand superfamily protein
MNSLFPFNNTTVVGNKKVEFDEFVALITTRREQTIKELRVLFDLFDKDKNGVLTKKEVKELLKVLEVDTSKRSCGNDFQCD